MLWALLWLTGRRDALHITATLRTAPRVQLRMRRHDIALEEGWSSLDLPVSYRAALRGGNAEKVRAALSPLLAPSTLGIERLDILSTAPHLQAEVKLAGLDGENLAALWAGLTDLCRAVGRGRSARKQAKP